MKILEQDHKKAEVDEAINQAKIEKQKMKEEEIKKISSLPEFKFVLELIDREIDEARDITTLPNTSLEEMGKAVLVCKEVVARLSRFKSKLTT